ncbi:Adenosylhomocysteinase [hydrothermal vent metagenome]|uniref:Adenosylhomocysteinase n=1 Tax=hydrothermal vent metagenome TaxID=652676 RepID=A0A3B0YXH0_9ZZZZ
MNSNIATLSDEERRDEKDRRHHSWHTVTYCGLHGRGRRRHARRAGHNYYLDWYSPGLVLTGVAVLVLSCLDALLTLTLMERGAYEANQFMAHLMDISISTFVATKIAITSAGILFLLMHSHFRILTITSGKQVLRLLLSVYGALIIYEIVLLGVVT